MTRRKRIDYEKEGKDLIRNSKEFKELKQLIIDNGCKSRFNNDLYIYQVDELYFYGYDKYLNQIIIEVNSWEEIYPYRYYLNDTETKTIQYVYKEDIQYQIDDLRKYINKANNNHS